VLGHDKKENVSFSNETTTYRASAPLQDLVLHGLLELLGDLDGVSVREADECTTFDDRLGCALDVECIFARGSG